MKIITLAIVMALMIVPIVIAADSLTEYAANSFTNNLISSTSDVDPSVIVDDPNPSIPGTPGVSSGGGSGKSSTNFQPNYNICHGNIWIQIKPFIFPDYVIIEEVIDVLNNPEFALCAPDFWFDTLRPVIIVR